MTKNLILLIGNGFDLAHGLKTSYNDFASSIRNKFTKELMNFKVHGVRSDNSFFKDQLFVDLRKGEGMPVQMSGFNGNYSSFLNCCHWYKSEKEFRELFQAQFPFGQVIKNSFLSKLFRNSYQNWFDIERAYFVELTLILNAMDNNSHAPKLDAALKKLNNELYEIKVLLEKYLNSLEISKDRSVINFFQSHLNSINYSNCHVVNFNYTNTIDYYRNYFHVFDGGDESYIHGRLNLGNMVFGYGDDTNNLYAKMKSSENDNFLTNFKTFQYSMDSEYGSLSDYLDSLKDYDVFILGHSLGATDKTLLKQILDTEKCQKIHLFKRLDLLGDGSEHNLLDVQDEYKKLLYALSRIIENDSDLRRKIIDFTHSTYFPQAGLKVQY